MEILSRGARPPESEVSHVIVRLIFPRSISSPVGLKARHNALGKFTEKVDEGTFMKIRSFM